jgi:preprotein translocase subunit YajC
MKNNFASLLSATVAVALATLAAAPVLADEAKPGATIAVGTTIKATVTKIDQKDRWVTLEMADGSVVDVQVGPAAKNFPQIRVGDVVTANQEETLAVAIVPAGQAAPNATGGSAMVTAPAGSKPLGVMVDTTVVSGQVTAIDYAKRSVTLLGPAGNSRTLQVGPAVQKFDAIKKGDNVVLTLKTATTIEVTAPAKK